jgi:glycerophosphoryl diester phosphodiesterase
MPPTLIAHRGYPARFPENTLIGYRAAIAAGAQWLETDIQLSRDGEPLLYHDADLLRTSGRVGRVADYPAEELVRLDAAEQDRFGDRYVGESIPRLRDFVRLLEPHESVGAMIELKQESLEIFGIEVMVQRVMHSIDSILDRCILISLHLPALCHARWTKEARIGWVLPAWNETNHELAEDHGPDFLFVDYKRVPRGHSTLWQGPWHWAVYSIDDADLACQQPARGIEFVETDAIGELLADKRFRPFDHRGTL